MLSTEVYDRRINQITRSMPIAFPDRRISALMRYADSHGLRCKQVDGAWHFYKDGAQWNDHIQAYKQPAYSLLVPRKLRIKRLIEERKATVTKFKVGDKVQTKLNKSWVAEVVAVKTVYVLKHEGGVIESSVAWFDEELEPAKVKLTVEEAWAEVGAMMMDYVGDVAGHLEEGGYSNIRNRAYAILWGNGIEVGRQNTEAHNALRHRLNVMIDRVIERFYRG